MLHFSLNQYFSLPRWAILKRIDEQKIYKAIKIISIGERFVEQLINEIWLFQKRKFSRGGEAHSNLKQFSIIIQYSLTQNMNINQISNQIEKINQQEQHRLSITSQDVVESQRAQNLLETKFESLQKFKPTQKKGGSFTKEELILFAHKFDQFKSRWTLYSKIFRRTEKEVKNLFYNSLRKLATQLSNAEKKRKQFQKNKIKALVLHNLINISFTVKQCFESMHMSMKQLLVFKIKDKIFQYCFINTQPREEEILELSRNIRKLKFGLKNLKVGKTIENQKQALKLAETMIQCQDDPEIYERMKSSLKSLPMTTTPSKPSPEPEQICKNEPVVQQTQQDQYYYDQNLINCSFYSYVPIPCSYLPFTSNFEFATNEINLIKAQPSASTILLKNQEWRQ